MSGHHRAFGAVIGLLVAGAIYITGALKQASVAQAQNAAYALATDKSLETVLERHWNKGLQKNRFRR